MGTVILTKELLQAGTNNGALNKKQCKLLGIPFFNNKKERKALYGKEVSEELYKEYCSLRITFGQKIAKRKQLKRLKADELVKDKKTKDFQELLASAKNNEVLETCLRAMKYKNFLKTRYWRTIRSYMIAQANGKCAVCGSNKRLNIHHKSYEHHGSEISHLEDLIVLCEECHQKVHNIYK